MKLLGKVELHEWQMSFLGPTLDHRVAGSHWELTGYCVGMDTGKTLLVVSSGRVKEAGKELQSNFEH